MTWGCQPPADALESDSPSTDTPPGVALWQHVATTERGVDYARAFADHFDDLAEQGTDIHGEARFVAALLAPGARVLDAGCGTGRVAAWLADAGFAVVGIDPDPAMVAEARSRRPDLTWVEADLVEAPTQEVFDAVVLAGNVVAFVGRDWPAAAQSIANVLKPGGSW